MSHGLEERQFSASRDELQTLDWILGPAVSTADFLNCHWAARPLHVRRSDGSYFSGLPGLADVDDLILSTTSGREQDGRIVRTVDSVRTERPFKFGSNGLPDIQDIYRAYYSGHTIVLNQTQRKAPACAALCASLETELHHRVGANLYLTPRHGQGFPVHTDDHAVFVLQLHGTKRWTVADRPGDPSTTGAGPSTTYTLDEGDTLYVPSGLSHMATTSGTSSLHLTVGIHTFTWRDFLDSVLEIMAEDGNPPEPIPAGFLDRSIEEEVSRFSRRLADVVAEPSVVRRATERLGALLCAAPKLHAGGQLASIDEIADLRPSTRVTRVPGLHVRARRTPDGVRVEFSGNFVSGPPELERAFFFVSRHRDFRISDLPGLPDEDKIELVARLISEGLVRQA